MRRPTLPAFVLVALFAFGLAPLGPAARAAEPTGWPVIASRTWIDGGNITVVARIRNNYGGWVHYPGVYLLLRDETDNILTTEYGEMAFDVMAPGADAFVTITAAVPAGYDHWDISVTGSSGPGTDALRPGKTVFTTIGAPTSDTDGRVYPFYIRNANQSQVAAMWFSMALYAADGSLVNVVRDVVGNFPVSTPDGWKVGVRFRDHYEGAVRAEVQAGTHISKATDPILATSDNYFEDLDSFRRDIIWVANEGITVGCAPVRYCPASRVTRGQMATFLVRAIDLPATATDYFTDDNGTPHEQDINRVAAAGITSGCAPVEYCPNNAVTRGAMASFLARALALPATATNYFTDDNGTTHEQNINRVAAAGITSGCTATTYCPNDEVTRGQMAAFLRRALD